MKIESVTCISEPEFRAVTKIALNYVAAVVGSETTLNPAFNDARNFARFCRAKDMIVAQLSLLVRMHYFVVLAEQAAGVPFTSTAHLFDLESRRLKEIEPLALTKGWALKPLKTS